MTFRTDDPEQIIELAYEWDRNQAQSDIMGYIGLRGLADRDEPGRYIMVADFGVVDPAVSGFEEAQRNNERPETQASAARMIEFATSEIEYHHYDELYRTDPVAYIYTKRD